MNRFWTVLRATDQGGRPDNEQLPQIFIAHFGDPAQALFATARFLTRDQAKPSGKLPPRAEACTEGHSPATVSRDTMAFVARVAEASGEPFEFRGNEQAQGWCARVGPMMDHDPAKEQKPDTHSFLHRFSELSLAAWGNLKDPLLSEVPQETEKFDVSSGESG